MIRFLLDKAFPPVQLFVSFGEISRQQKSNPGGLPRGFHGGSGRHAGGALRSVIANKATFWT
jgi:hypothetical protein